MSGHRSSLQYNLHRIANWTHMTLIYSGNFHTTMSQMYLESSGFNACEYFAESFLGQSNGLIGTAVPGGAVLVVGIHTGKISLTVDLFDTQPPIDDTWEEIVEASCVVTDTPVYLNPCMGDASEELSQLLVGVYRVRFCARMFGETDTAGVLNSSENYLLALWPDILRPDEIIKQTRPKAISWHQAAAKRNADPTGHIDTSASPSAT